MKGSLFIKGIGIPVWLMWGIGGWCGRGGSGKRCDGACVCEREGMNSVVNTVIVWIGSECGRSVGGTGEGQRRKTCCSSKRKGL